MNYYSKVRRSIDWNNHYTINKALNTLKAEFDKALKANNTAQTKSILVIVQRLYDDLSTSYRESSDYSETMSYAQRTAAKKFRAFIAWMTKAINDKAHIKSREEEIKQIIDGGAAK